MVATAARQEESQSGLLLFNLSFVVKKGGGRCKATKG